MSRSNDFYGFPGSLDHELLLELLPARCVATLLAQEREERRYPGRCPHCLEFHYDALHDALIPPDAVVAALIRRGWYPRVAHRFVEYDVLGRRYSHVPHDFGSPMSYRAWRRRAKVLVAADRADEIGRFMYDRGYRYW